jgi:hypothetical protein
VLTEVPTYGMWAMMLPLGVRAAIGAQRRAFLWTDSDKVTGVKCLVAREDVVRIDLPPLGPMTFGPCSRALIGGVQPYMVGGPPSHSAIKGKVGAGARGMKFTTPPVTPPTS